MNVSKANYICTGENVMPAVKNAIAQDKIFEAQLQNYINKYNRANEMCTFYKRNVQKKDFFSRQTKSVQSVFEQRLNSRLETQNQTLFS